MEPPSDRDIERLREIARRVGELAHGRPEVVERLHRSWVDYIALHVGHMEEEREKALLQRSFAIEVLKKGFLNEHPRKDHEPAWHQEPFRVRIPTRLAAQSRAANTPAKLASYHTKVADAILRYIRDEDEIADCANPVKRQKLFKRRWTAKPLGRSIAETFLVGVRKRPECKVSPHPLYCNWREFQSLLLPTRITVALATLVVLHDELSATPILKPFPHDLPEEEAEAHQLIVAWAVWECLSSTSEGAESTAPPRPDPSRLSVERADAFIVLLETTILELGVSDDMDIVTANQRGMSHRDNPTLVGSATAFGLLADNPPNLRSKEWEAFLRNWLRSVGNTTREQLGVIGLPSSGFKRATLHDERPSVNDSTVWLGLIASVFVDGVVPISSVLDATPDVLACFAFSLRDLRRSGPAPVLEVEAKAVIATFKGLGKYELSVSTLVTYTQRALRTIATMEPESRRQAVVKTSLSQTAPTMADLATAAGISDDTFGRVRKAAGINHGLKGTKARGFRYSPDLVDRLIAAALAGTFIERAAMAEKWSNWAATKRK